MHHGETASIRDRERRVVFTYRGFASIVGIVAALVLAVVLLTGLAAALFLNAEGRPGAATAAAVLAFLFGFVIAALIPRTRVTLYHEGEPALRIVQTSRFSLPATTWSVRTADGNTLAHLRKSALSRLGMNRWSISAPPGESGIAYAAEESFDRALVRKFLGKFKPQFEANMRVVHQGTAAAVIIRRPDAGGEADYIEMTAGSDLDPRVTLALATLVFGLEP